MKTKDNQLHANFFKFTEDNKRKVKCKFCGHKSAENVTRMREHINSCERVPQRPKTPVTPVPGHTLTPLLPSLEAENAESSPTTSAVPSTTASASKFVEPAAVTGKCNVKIDKFLDRMSADEQQKGDTLFARAVYSTGIPLSFTENDHVQEFFAFIRPTWKPPSRFLLSESLLEAELKTSTEDVRSMIASADVLAVVTDGWTNVNMKPIINFLITTPTPVFVKSIETGQQEHTADYIAHEISAVIQEHNPSKVLAVVSDNASAMRKAWEFVTFEFPHIQCYGCTAHVFNLLAQDICKMKTVSSVISNAKSVIKFFKYRQIPRAVLEKMHCTSDPGCQVRAVVLPVATRWGSNAQALERLLHMKNALQKAVVDKKLEKSLHSQKEIRKLVLDEVVFWPQVENLHKLLKPVADAITMLEGDNPQLGKVIQLFAKLDRTMNELAAESPLTKKEEQELRGRLNYRFNYCMRGIHFAANLLDPRYCGKTLTDEMLGCAYTSIAQIAANTEGCDSNKVLSELSLFCGRLGIFATSVIWQASHSVQPYIWWKGLVASSTPQLAVVASKILQMPPTSAASERNWSIYGNVQSKSRSRLTDTHAQKLVYIKHNMDVLKHAETQVSGKETGLKACKKNVTGHKGQKACKQNEPESLAMVDGWKLSFKLPKSLLAVSYNNSSKTGHRTILHISKIQSQVI